MTSHGLPMALKDLQCRTQATTVTVTAVAVTSSWILEPLPSILLFLRFKKKKQDKFTNNKVNNDSVIDLEKDPRTKEYKPKD